MGGLVCELVVLIDRLSPGSSDQGIIRLQPGGELLSFRTILNLARAPEAQGLTRADDPCSQVWIMWSRLQQLPGPFSEEIPLPGVGQKHRRACDACLALAAPSDHLRGEFGRIVGVPADCLVVGLPRGPRQVVVLVDREQTRASSSRAW